MGPAGDSQCAIQVHAKLWQRFTHERDTPWAPADVKYVTAGLTPLTTRRLGCLIVQFPWSFKSTAANEEWLGDVLAAFAPFPLGVEVRHSSCAEQESTP